MEFKHNAAFKRYVAELVAEYKGKRIHSFAYQNRFFWLKQPERLKGIWKILKPDSTKSLRHEIRRLQELAEYRLPVVKLVLCGEDYFVSEDAGRSVNLCIEDDLIAVNIKQNILNDCAKALAELHGAGFIHGRPALRDMVWRDGKITFIDLEEYGGNGKNLHRQKIRDCLIFIHALFRAQGIEYQQKAQALITFRQHSSADLWRDLLNFLFKYRWLYYLSLPFKPVAKTDLAAFYLLYENLLPQLNEERRK